MPTDISTTAGNRPDRPTENKSKDSKSGNQKKTQIIMEFLHECIPYEADALRAMMGIATGKISVETMPQYDRSAVNRFLNFGCDKEASGTFRKLLRGVIMPLGYKETNLYAAQEDNSGNGIQIREWKPNRNIL